MSDRQGAAETGEGAEGALEGAEGAPPAQSALHDAECVPTVYRSDQEWRHQLTPQRYQVLREAGTEPPFTGEYVYNKASGMYLCAGCGAELFSSDSKFDSHTGWPSFTQPAVAQAVLTKLDSSHFMRRTEVLCRRCGGHLGHVFHDGPKPTGERFCINSASLQFKPQER